MVTKRRPALSLPPGFLGPAVWIFLTFGLPAPLVLAGCRLFEEAATASEQGVRAVVPGTSSTIPDPGALQQRLMRFADDAIRRVNRALDDYGTRATTVESAEMVLEGKLAYTAIMVGIVTDPNPNGSLVDLLSVATMTRSGLEAYAERRPDAALLAPLVEVARAIETAAWALGDDVLDATQRKELREAIQAWLAANPDPSMTIFTRPQDHVAKLRTTLEAKPANGKTLSWLLALDPMVGLDPAVREVTESRLFAERAMFALQRVPPAVRWQAELLTLKLARLAEVQALVSSAKLFAESADRVSRTMDELPDRLSAEREALVGALDEHEGRLTALAVELRRTLEAGEAMSTSLDVTLATFDALMARFGVGEPEREEPPAEPGGRRFDILEYATTAEAITATAKELNAVIRDLNGTLDSPALDARIDALDAASKRTAAEVRGILNHAFLLAAVLAGVVLACTILYRLLARSGAAHRRTPA